MMEYVSSLLLGLCFAAVLGAIVRLLSPGGSTARLMRLCTALFVLVSVARPVGKLLHDLPAPAAAQSVQTAAEAVLETARNAIEQTARQTLDAHGCAQAQIQVKMQVKDGQAHAEVFRVTGVPPAQKQEIEDELFALTGERPVVESAALETARP